MARYKINPKSGKRELIEPDSQRHERPCARKPDGTRHFPTSDQLAESEQSSEAPKKKEGKS